MKSLTAKDVKWTIDALPEDVSISEHFDKSIADEIIRELEIDQWAWCTVRVTGEFRGLEDRTYLGCCSYFGGEDEFRVCGYYEDMQYEVLEMLNEKIADLFEALEKIS